MRSPFWQRLARARVIARTRPSFAFASMRRNQGERPSRRDQRTLSGEDGSRSIASSRPGVSPANTGISLVLTTIPALPNEAPVPGSPGSMIVTPPPADWMNSAAHTPAMPDPTTRQSGWATGMSSRQPTFDYSGN